MSRCVMNSTLQLLRISQFEDKDIYMIPSPLKILPSKKIKASQQKEGSTICGSRSFPHG